MAYTNKSVYIIYIITKTYLYNFDPIIPDFYIVKLGFTGVVSIFLISSKKDCGYSLEQPREAVLTGVLTIYVFNRNMKNIRIFI